MVSTVVCIALTSLTEEDTKVVFAILVQLLSFVLTFLGKPFSEFDLSDCKRGKQMETFCSNTVTLHLLICSLDPASTYCGS